MERRQGHRLCGWICAAVTVAIGFGAVAQQRPSRRQLIIVVDGLRPDYVTSDAMPHLARLGERGIVFTAHHSVFPTVTRVNGSSLVTGSYPETHGLLGNAIYIPAVSPTRVLDTGAREDLVAVERAVGRLLTAPSLGESLERAGKRLAGFSSGSTGSAYLLNQAARNRVIVHNDYALPQNLADRVLKRLGPTPTHATPNIAQHRRAIDAYLAFGVDELHADAAIIWLNDPDATAHAKGIGSPASQEALAGVDAEIGRLEDALRARGLLDQTNIIVTSDHGFSTHTGGLELEAFVEPFVQKMADGSPDIVVAEGAVHFRGKVDQARVARLVAALQKRPEVGAIFTRPRPGGGAEGVVPGTLSFDVARWNHRRAGDVLVSANWTANANDAGYAGTTTDDGVAGHGSSSPYDIHNTLIAAGPDFREHATSGVPTANVDIAPTVLRLLGVPIPASMTGRVIEEAFRTGPSPESIHVEQTTQAVHTADESYTLTAHVSAAAGHRYLDFTDVARR
ncbi:MAG TPA: alkaline phosphatase family protein [Vicinamibacterales bacterium]|nr:alkaline phosphatase family protein [Vicinamibacterales bacterium]